MIVCTLEHVYSCLDHSVCTADKSTVVEIIVFVQREKSTVVEIIVFVQREKSTVVEIIVFVQRIRERDRLVGSVSD